MLFDKPKIKRLQKPFLIFTGVLFLDQILKNLFLTENIFQKNYNALFGIEINLAFAIATFLAFLLFIWQKRKSGKVSERCAIALIFSGILSNMIDKIRFGFIIDYINLFNIFIFNLADVAILCGAGVFIWQIIKE